MEEERCLDWKVVFKEILGGKKTNSDTDAISSSEKCRNEATSNKSNLAQNKHKSCTLDPVSKPQMYLFDWDSTNFVSVSENPKYGAYKVPEWNKVFKEILGSPPVPTQEKPSINRPHKAESLSSQKNPVPVQNKRFYPKKKYHSVSKLEKDKEYEKVEKIFASSRFLPPKICFQTLNDFAGSGVDLFKDKGVKLAVPERFKTRSYSSTQYVKPKSCSSMTEISSKSKRKVHFADECATLDNIEPDIPVSGFVANMKILTSEDIRNAPIIPFDEPAWDDDLLYY